ncbi:MAG: beta-galactosidase, partial [Planctomycetes bacterium]|nr:beta-galactosidase [Planctomycetota bacterium]
MKYRSICVVLTAILLAPGLLAQDWKAQEYTMEPGNLGTPTTRWLGQQYSGGKISVLILKGDQLGYRQNTRQPMELLRAFPFMDIEYSLYGYHMSDNERTLKLLESRKWDVIVSWDHWRAPWPKLSNEAKFRVLSTVADGTGILFVRRPPRNVLRKDRQIETPVNDIAGGLGLTGRAGRTEKYFNRLPREEGAFKKAFATAYKVGKGRALVFSRFKIEDNSGAKLFRWDHSIDHQYMMAEMGRAILWTAQKEPRVKFVSTPPALRKLAWGKTRGQTGKWILDAGKNPLDLTIKWRVRDLKGHVLARDERKFEGAKDKITCQFTLPDLDAGRYYTDLLIKSARGGENYGYAGLHVPAPCEVELNQKQKGVEPDGKLAGTALFTLQEEQEIPKPALLLEVLDNHDRIVVRRRVDAEPGQKVPYAFSIDPHYPIQMRVRARVVAGKREAGSAWLTYHILRRRHDRFNMVLWGSWNGPYRHWGKLKLRETGVTSSLSGKSEVANINRTPTNFAYNWPVGEKKMRSPRPKKDPELGVSVMQPACWNDEEAFQKMLSAKDGVFESGTRTPVFVYNMYDEGPHSGMCLHPECLKAYRSWLKEFYEDDLDALNREWESDYKSWDQVNVMKKGDNHEKAAREAGIYARWSDRKHFGEVNFCRRMIGGLTERARKYDPKALVGFEGSGGFGMDFDELISNSGFWCPYDGIRTEVVRSLKPEGFIHSFWIGYNKKGDRLIARAWRAVINDAPSIWWWMLAGRGRFHGWLAPNNEPYPENRRFLDEVIIPLRRGLGDLLMQLDQKHDGIALYYSVAASHAGELTEAAAFNSVKGAHGSILRLIEDCGYQWVYTTRKRTLKGDLKERGIKLLILPFIQALGQKEVDTLRKFVKNGGTVLADLRPGVYSG